MKNGWRQNLAALLLGLAVLAAALAPPAALAQARGPTVFAAASLQTALDAIAAAWQRESGKRAVIAYGGSSALARQIEAGAPADLFISADSDWMDYLAGKGLVRAATRRDLLGNTLVLVAAKTSAIAATIAPGFGLAALLGRDGRLALANVDTVPAGKYAKAALQSLGVWESVAARLAQTADVRAALALVARGETPLGIVYGTDAHAEGGVKVVGTFPATSHPKIVYPLAELAASSNPDAAAFAAFLSSPAATAIFEREGFTILP
ncbi:MAG: molybdate ABC transporter substrate-binding protein [Bauldia sp.]